MLENAPQSTNAAKDLRSEGDLSPQNVPVIPSRIQRFLHFVEDSSTVVIHISVAKDVSMLSSQGVG